MKLLHMPNRTSDAAVTLWATEGNLARAAKVHTNCIPKQNVEKTEKTAPVFRVVLHPETAFYRSYTEAILRRFGVLSMESGRVPSLLGREMFRGKVTNYQVRAFDDVVIFVHDVQQCMRLLRSEQQRLIIRIGVQEHTFSEAAAMFELSLRSVQRRYFEALDELTAVFLKRRLLERIATQACQEGKVRMEILSTTP